MDDFDLGRYYKLAGEDMKKERKMTQDEKDIKEFEEWWNKEIIEVGELKELKPRWFYAKLSWLASRRKLREKEKQDG